MSDPSPTPRPSSRPLRGDEWVALIVAFLGFGALGLWFTLRMGDGPLVTMGALGRDRAVPGELSEGPPGGPEGSTAAQATELSPFPKGASPSPTAGTAGIAAPFITGVGAPTQTPNQTSGPMAGPMAGPMQGSMAGQPPGPIAGQPPTQLNQLDPAAIAAAQAAAQTTTSAAATPTPAPAFEDVPEGYWARPFVIALAQQRIVAGFEDGRFLPEEAVTRAQFASLLTAAFGDRPDAAPSKTFTDIPDDYWGKTAIARAVQLGFMKGYPDGSFQPDRPIPRLELAVALSTGLQLAPPPNPPEILGRFSDGNGTPAWAAPKLAAAANRRLLTNHPDPQRLDLAAPATRAQVAVILYQTQVLTDQAPAIASPYLFP